MKNWQWKLLALWILGGVLFVVIHTCRADGFNERGIWIAVSSQTIPHGGSRSFGVRDVTDRDLPFNIMAYGTTGGDSLRLTITLYGMMSYLLSDTTKVKIIKTVTTTVASGAVISLADTLDDVLMFPYLYGKVTNNASDSSAIVTLWVYMRARETNIAQ
jgi:hypothetical protein